ncbi:MAG: hypothetical protein QM763_00430 [Agriterribacter sp.]
MEIIEVTNKSLLNLFLDAPGNILKNYPHYITPILSNVKDTLSIKKNPLWQVAERKLFVALKKGKAAGTIAAIYYSQHKQYNPEDAVYFGYLHFEDDPELLHELVSVAKKFASEKKVSTLIGPLNPSLNYELGILTEGFDSDPFFMMNYNPPYYPALIEKEGGKVAMEFLAYNYRQGIKRGKIERVSELLKKRYDVQIENINFRKFEAESNELCAVYNDAFEGHFGFVPFSEKEFLFMAKALKQILNQQLLFKVKLKGNTAGFMLTIPDINQAVKKLHMGRLTPWGIAKFIYRLRKIDSAKVMLVAIRKRYQKFGLGSILYNEMNERTKKAGYLHGEISWVAEENNKMQKIVESIGAEPYKKYAVYRFDV